MSGSLSDPETLIFSRLVSADLFPLAEYRKKSVDPPEDDLNAPRPLRINWNSPVFFQILVLFSS